MDLFKKLTILADSAKYDASCSSSGSNRKNSAGGIGNGALGGICHTWSADGRCVSLLKILLTNICIYDCAYCINRQSNDQQRAIFTPEEIADLTINFYRKNYIEGLFLSSGIVKSPDYTMELIIRALKILRERYRFNGYIHIKLIPGADSHLLSAAGKLADRVSINIELPSSVSLKRLAPEKKSEAILKPMKQVGTLIAANREEKKRIKKTPSFVPAGQSTQLIVGATPESDLKIIHLSENLYQKMDLKRVYYSAYIHVNQDKRLPLSYKPELLREHRLYQADWLLRMYGFGAHEILDDTYPNLDQDFDPKVSWALRHLEHFPVEINQADLHTLLRVPGIGIRSARRIVVGRKVQQFSWEDLKKLGVVLKRAQFFITVKGKYYGRHRINEQLIASSLSERKSESSDLCQLDLFSQTSYKKKERSLIPSHISGEL
ncbi:putative DNA modification/repair radical SAM protein [Candidatus Auribacterota bacterium]